MGIHHHKSLLIFGTQAALLTGGGSQIIQYCQLQSLQYCSTLLHLLHYNAAVVCYVNVNATPTRCWQDGCQQGLLYKLLTSSVLHSVLRRGQIWRQQCHVADRQKCYEAWPPPYCTVFNVAEANTYNCIQFQKVNTQEVFDCGRQSSHI